MFVCGRGLLSFHRRCVVVWFVDGAAFGLHHDVCALIYVNWFSSIDTYIYTFIYIGSACSFNFKHCGS